MTDTASIFVNLSDALTHEAPAEHYVVAYSGGLDSHVLLHALSRLAADQGLSFSAVHVHHGLHPEADSWVEHCRSICSALGIGLEVVHVDARAEQGESPEARAREARYAALADYLRPGQALLTAHHLDDQAETFMLQLLRGSGLRGLSAMPVTQSFASGTLCRPLLRTSRDTLRAYAIEHALHWIEDSSNTDTNYDRNYLRYEVMPLLLARWPAARQTIARAAGHAAETVAMAETLARQDGTRLRRIADNSLSVSGLLELEPDRRRNLLRAWIRDQGFPIPSSRRLEQLATDMLQAAPDRDPRVCWDQAEARRYRDRLHLLPPLPQAVSEQRISWQGNSPLELPLGTMQACVCTGRGVRADAFRPQDLEIGFRRDGETIRPAGSRHHRSLKKLLQERAVPPWLRDLLPLVFINDQLAAVPGICVAADWAATDMEKGIEFHWQLPPSLAGLLPNP